MSTINPNPIISLHKPELLSRSEKNCLYSIVKEIELFSLLRENNSEFDAHILADNFSLADKKPEIWRSLGQILQEDSIRNLAFLISKEEAFTYYTLSRQINLPQSTLYRNLKILTDLGIINPSLPVNVPHERGRKVIVFQTPDATPERILQVCQLHRKIKSPMYVQGLRVKQILLENYPHSFSHKEITKTEVLELMRKENIPNRPQVIDFVTQQLSESGIKVWR